jgi:cytochrome c oxidase cbb3-type subunit 4
MDFGLFHSVWTLILVAMFIGIVRWAWSDRRRESFARAEREPLSDEEDSQSLPLSPGGRGQGVRGRPLIPTPSPSRGEGRGPSALRAISIIPGDRTHG